MLSIDIKEAFYGTKKVLSNINLQLNDGDILAVVGETGAGKTTIAKIISGIYKFYGINFNGSVHSDKKISFVPQNISESLDPLFTVEAQMREINDDMELIRDTLLKVGFFDVERVLKYYPHNLSGGMKQRVLTAMALLEGDVLIADEFTSALDRTTKFQIVELFKKLNEEFNITIIFITHDIELLRFKGLLMVMHMGEIVEFGDADSIKNNPYHPYMKFLMGSIPKEDMHYTKDRFKEVSINKTAACPFVEICDNSQELCYKIKPELKEHDERLIRCHF